MDLILIQDSYMEIIAKGFDEALELWEGNEGFDFYRYNFDGNDENIVRMVEAIRNKTTMAQNEERRKRVF